MSLYVVLMYQAYHLPRVRGSGFARVRVPKPQQQHHWVKPAAAAAVVSRRGSRVLAPQRVNPTLAVGRTCNVPSKFTQQQQYYRSTTLSGNVMPLQRIIFTNLSVSQNHPQVRDRSLKPYSTYKVCLTTGPRLLHQV